MANRILIIFAHPALERSRVHRRLIQVPRSMSGVTVHDLYQCYPEFYLDVDREQGLLLEHDVVVFQHPFYWYSAPAIVRQWQDMVLQHGWAYGSEGTQLRGKGTMHVVSCGGGKAAYRAGGHNRFSIGEFLRPFEQTAALCGMQWRAPFVVFDTLRLPTEQIDEHCGRYEALLTELREAPFETPAARGPE
ncbi:MAG: NAD(P)H-dependent oxidoreductase [Myxococcota bacterium]